MYNRLSQAILTTLAVFTGAVALSMSTSGTLSDIGFFIYAAALVLLRGAGRCLAGRAPSAPDGAPPTGRDDVLRGGGMRALTGLALLLGATALALSVVTLLREDDQQSREVSTRPHREGGRVQVQRRRSEGEV